MFVTPVLTAIFVLAKLFLGSLLGLSTAALVYRSRFSIGLGLRAMAYSGAVFVLLSCLAAWAGSHAAFRNGHRLDMAPWGEGLRLRNFIATNELLLCVMSGSAAAVLAGISFRR